jgi:hypothetical protein
MGTSSDSIRNSGVYSQLVKRCSDQPIADLNKFFKHRFKPKEQLNLQLFLVSGFKVSWFHPNRDRDRYRDRLFDYGTQNMERHGFVFVCLVPFVVSIRSWGSLNTCPLVAFKKRRRAERHLPPPPNPSLDLCVPRWAQNTLQTRITLSPTDYQKMCA